MKIIFVSLFLFFILFIILVSNFVISAPSTPPMDAPLSGVVSNNDENSLDVVAEIETSISIESSSNSFENENSFNKLNDSLESSTSNVVGSLNIVWLSIAGFCFIFILGLIFIKFGFTKKNHEDVNKEYLRKFIKNNLKTYSFRDIENHLVQQGFDVNLIENTFESLFK